MPTGGDASGQLDEWYVHVNGTELGPLDFRGLTRLVGKGLLNRQMHVTRVGSGVWVEAGDVPSLFPPLLRRDVPLAESPPLAAVPSVDPVDRWTVRAPSPTAAPAPPLVPAAPASAELQPPLPPLPVDFPEWQPAPAQATPPVVVVPASSAEAAPAPAPTFDIDLNGGRGAGYLARHWRGDLSLPVSCGINTIAVSAVVAAALAGLMLAVRFDTRFSAVVALVLLTMAWTVAAAILVWQAVGVWRASGRYARAHPGAPASLAAKGVPAIVAFGLITGFAAWGGPQIADAQRAYASHRPAPVTSAPVVAQSQAPRRAAPASAPTPPPPPAPAATATPSAAPAPAFTGPGFAPSGFAPSGFALAPAVPPTASAPESMASAAPGFSALPSLPALPDWSGSRRDDGPVEISDEALAALARGGASADQLDRMLLRIPIYEAIRKVDPASYTRMRERLAAGLARKASAADLSVELFHLVERAVTDALPQAAEPDLVAYLTFVVKQLDAANRLNPSDCYVLIHPERATTEAVRDVRRRYEGLRAEEVAIKSRILLGRDKAMKPPAGSTIGSTLDRLLTTVQRRPGVDVALFASEQVSPDKHRTYCNSIIGMYEEVLKLPRRTGIEVLRYLFAVR